jgi:hypothetical protein
MLAESFGGGRKKGMRRVAWNREEDSLLGPDPMSLYVACHQCFPHNHWKSYQTGRVVSMFQNRPRAFREGLVLGMSRNVDMDRHCWRNSTTTPGLRRDLELTELENQ